MDSIMLSNFVGLGIGIIICFIVAFILIKLGEN